MNMKRIIAALSTLTIVIAVIVIAKLFNPITQPAVASIQFSGFPIDQVRAVDFDASANELQANWREERSLIKNGKISRRDLLDQYRDWLLISIVSSLNQPLDDIAKVLYDVPVIRNDYLRRVASIDSGMTRWALIGNGEVIALVPAGETPECIDHLARIADEQRKNLGEIPSIVHIFEYEIIPDEQFARVTRRTPLDGKALFTETYGYREQNIGSLKDFRSFMGRTDDITYARKEGSAIVLGSRKILSRKYRGIRVEDAATVWKSENDRSSQQSGSDSRSTRRWTLQECQVTLTICCWSCLTRAKYLVRKPSRRFKDASTQLH